jgi:hypothetical protein
MQFSMNVILNKYEDFSKKKEENEIRKTTKMYSRNKMKKEEERIWDIYRENVK